MDEGSYEARKTARTDRVEMTMRAERRRPGCGGPTRHRDRTVVYVAQADAHCRNDRVRRCRVGAETSDASLLVASAAAGELGCDPGLGAANGINVAVDLLNDARVRIGNGASAALLSHVFVALAPLVHRMPGIL